MNKYYFEVKKKLVEEDKSRVYQNWHEYQGINKEDFINGLKWLCDDPCDERGRVTRGLGCIHEEVRKLKKVCYPSGVKAHYDMTTGYLFSGNVYITPHDSI